MESEGPAFHKGKRDKYVTEESFLFTCTNKKEPRDSVTCCYHNIVCKQDKDRTENQDLGDF